MLLAFVLAGVIALAVLGWEVASTIGFLNNSARAEGVVVDARAHPWIEFAPANGTTVRFQQNGHLSAKLGTRVAVAYRSSDPQGTARVHGFWTDWGDVFDILPVAGFAILAMILAVVGLFR